MITITHPHYSPITVLGYAVNYKDYFCTSYYDMRDPDWKEDIRRNFGEEDSDYDEGYLPYKLSDYYDGDEQDYEELNESLYIEYLIDHALITNSDWGDNETAFDTIDKTIERNRVLLAMNGKCLDELVDDESTKVAAAVARYGDKRHKDKLVHHPHPLVREALIDDPRGCATEHLDILVEMGDATDLICIAQNHREYAVRNIKTFLNSKSFMVWATMAQIGNEEDIAPLINVKDKIVRVYLARRGFESLLDELVFDESPLVRAEVAKHSAYHRALIDDEDVSVLEEIINHSEGCILHPLLSLHQDPEVRRLVARVCEDGILAHLADDTDYRVRLEVARRGAALDKLKKDEDKSVRATAENYAAQLNC